MGNLFNYFKFFAGVLICISALYFDFVKSEIIFILGCIIIAISGVSVQFNTLKSKGKRKIDTPKMILKKA